MSNSTTNVNTNNSTAVESSNTPKKSEDEMRKEKLQQATQVMFERVSDYVKSELESMRTNF